MIIARRKEQEFFASSPEYSHLSSRMGSEYLAKLLSQVLENPFGVLSLFLIILKLLMLMDALLFPPLST